MNWKKLEGYPSLHQEVATTSLPDGREVSIWQSITNGATYIVVDSVWHYATLHDILGDYLAVAEGDTELQEQQATNP